jgi:hypothetical protein
MSDFAAIRFQPQRPLLRELSADRLNTILQEIRRNKPKGERGITVRQSGDGTYIGLAASLPAGKGGVATRQPWDLIATPDPESTAENPPYKIRVQPGTVSRILPTNWDQEFTANPDTLYYAVVILQTDGRFIAEATIQISDQAPDEQEPQKYGIENPVEILFGLFKDGTSYNVAGGRDINLVAQAVLATSADPPATVGQSPYDIWFRLQ